MNFLTDWFDVTSLSVQQSWDHLSIFAPRIVGAVVIAVVGWLVVWLIAYVLEQILEAVRVQKLFDQIRIEEIVKKWGSKFTTTGLVVEGVRWFLYLAVFLAAISVLDLPATSQFVSEILTYAGQAVAAAAIVVVGFVLATFLSMLVAGAVMAADLGHAGAAGSVTKFSIMVVTAITALRVLGLTPQQLNVAYIGLVAFLAIAGGLSFGLGAQRAAEKSLEELRKGWSGK